jgi:hypothetical protein
MSTSTSEQMEQASIALAKMDYLACEALCLAALTSARRDGNWSDYARILLPLQEARRQRRMIAAEGKIRLGSASLDGSPGDWLRDHAPMCIAFTRPHTADDAAKFTQLAGEQHKFVEALFVDSDMDAATWIVRSFAGPNVRCELAAPPREAIDAWTDSDRWFLAASEALGDAALQTVTAKVGTIERVEQLEHCLGAATDHEILHQRLWDAAQALAGA